VKQKYKNHPDRQTKSKYQATIKESVKNIQRDNAKVERKSTTVCFHLLFSMPRNN
jgi:hypothetical protein